ncbi:dynein light chain Tctex-type 4 [Anolis carolinensis]|uniref:dynein light chain Tctex-type 4 n=1 Tax=Anolis carolinensis TaxID=28377 RepID=UPI000203925D|nr:PREDICTED: tctex1 domain-containing protein 4 [Anolis carolinensis]|eukprot:XP_008107745.1 PREDICTED: tctex1 domain-containing protein 4 [Anolis carolinensis]
MADWSSAPFQQTPNQGTASEDNNSTHPKAGLLSLRRNSQSTIVVPRTLLQLPSIEGKAPLPLSRRSSIMSSINAPFSSRRNSLAAGGRRLSIGTWMHYGRVSFSGLPLFEPIRETLYENTYKTQPDEGCKFNSSQTQQLLESVLASYLRDAKYNPTNSGQLAQNLSDLIRSRVKDLSPPRYKLVCNVFLGQQAKQDLHIASRSLWDVENDNFASAAFTNTSMFAVATVHGLYFE